MRVLVLGNGGREHALVARLSSEPSVDSVLCAPGNPGMRALARTIPADLRQPDALVALASAEGVDFTIAGPELPLSLGVADRFESAGLPLFGPTAAAAQLESSKAFAKSFMARHGVPTARFRVCEDQESALECVRSAEFGFPVVLKADGLAAGKGVVIAADRAEAEAVVTAAMSERKFGDAGARLVFEECLSGPEVSFFVISDGTRALPIGTAQDHKRIFDDDRGPNTGGMGAFAPSPLIDGPLERRIMDGIVGPVIRGMKAEGHPFRGFLYVGLMLTVDGPKVIEFNVRLGDPEAQVILPLIDSPLMPLLIAAQAGNASDVRCHLSSDRFVGVVIASRGYPESSESGQPIEGLDDAARVPGVVVCHAGTAEQGGRIVTAGGRVLTVVGRGMTYEEATARAYEGVAALRFDGMQYRRDIGRKAIQTPA